MTALFRLKMSPQFFSFLDIDDMDDETEYDLIKEVPKVYFSKDYSNVFHC